MMMTQLPGTKIMEQQILVGRASDIATSADGAQAVHVADMDGDGDLDIISASAADDTIAWYENNGAADPSWTASDIVNRCRCSSRCFP